MIKKILFLLLVIILIVGCKENVVPESPTDTSEVDAGVEDLGDVDADLAFDDLDALDAELDDVAVTE